MIREKNDLLIPNEFWFHTRYLTDSEIVAILRKSYVVGDGGNIRFTDMEKEDIAEWKEYEQQWQNDYEQITSANPYVRVIYDSFISRIKRGIKSFNALKDRIAQKYFTDADTSMPPPKISEESKAEQDSIAKLRQYIYLEDGTYKLFDDTDIEYHMGPYQIVEKDILQYLKMYGENIDTEMAVIDFVRMVDSYYNSRR